MAGRSLSVVLLVLGTVVTLLLGARLFARTSASVTTAEDDSRRPGCAYRGLARLRAPSSVGLPAERPTGDRSWLPPFSPAAGGIAQAAHPPADRGLDGGRMSPSPHQASEEA